MGANELEQYCLHLSFYYFPFKKTIFVTFFKRASNKKTYIQEINGKDETNRFFLSNSRRWKLEKKVIREKESGS